MQAEITGLDKLTPPERENLFAAIRRLEEQGATEIEAKIDDAAHVHVHYRAPSAMGIEARAARPAGV